MPREINGYPVSYDAYDPATDIETIDVVITGTHRVTDGTVVTIKGSTDPRKYRATSPVRTPWQFTVSDALTDAIHLLQRGPQ